MNIIKPEVVVWHVDEGHPSPAKAQIEKAMRVCYKSHDKATESSYETLYNNAVKREHLNCLEHGTFYINLEQVPYDVSEYLVFAHDNVCKLYMDSEYCWGQVNGRTLLDLENTFKSKFNTLEIAPEQVKNDPHYKDFKRVTLYLTLSRGIADEFVRHRVLSPLMESSRYVRYGDISFILPDMPSEAQAALKDMCQVSENMYQNLLDLGVSPQYARDALIPAYATHLVLTGFMKDWREFCRRRTAPGVHPEAIKVAKMIEEQLNNL